MLKSERKKQCASQKNSEHEQRNMHRRSSAYTSNCRRHAKKCKSWDINYYGRVRQSPLTRVRHPGRGQTLSSVPKSMELCRKRMNPNYGSNSWLKIAESKA